VTDLSEGHDATDPHAPHHPRHALLAVFSQLQFAPESNQIIQNFKTHRQTDRQTYMYVCAASAGRRQVQNMIPPACHIDSRRVLH